MDKTGIVFYNGIKAGRIRQQDRVYIFTYDDSYLTDPLMPPIAIAFPKSVKEFRSPVLFPFFFGLLAEGANKELQCKSFKIDEHDHFGRLLKAAPDSTIGAISVREEE